LRPDEFEVITRDYPLDKDEILWVHDFEEDAAEDGMNYFALCRAEGGVVGLSQGDYQPVEPITTPAHAGAVLTPQWSVPLSYKEAAAALGYESERSVRRRVADGMLELTPTGKVTAESVRRLQQSGPRSGRRRRGSVE
jgi:hypothetical protein